MNRKTTVKAGGPNTNEVEYAGGGGSGGDPGGKGGGQSGQGT